MATQQFNNSKMPGSGNPNAAKEQRLTYAVQWARDLPGVSDEKGVELWAVRAGGEKVRIRSTLVSHMYKMRAANQVQDTVTDVSFLSQGMDSMLEAMGFARLELAIAPMSPKKDKAQRIEFPPDAFEHGTTKGAPASK